MPISFMLLLVAQTASGPTPACQKLMRDFVRNEVTFATIHDINNDVLIAERNFAKATSDWSGVEKQRRSNAESDEQYRQQADRIVTLMTAQSCPLPDHVANPETYRTIVKACEADKTNPLCDIEGRAMTDYRSGRSPTSTRGKATSQML